MHTEDFNFHLPDDLIAQFPAAERRSSRLLTLDGNSGQCSDRAFEELPQLLCPDDLLVFNDTRVIKARLNGVKESGGKVEVLIERILNDHDAIAQVRASKAPKPGNRLIFSECVSAVMIERRDDMFLLRFNGERRLDDILEHHGTLPLPPYIQHAAGEVDEQRYQTVYAREPGAVAAPTAGLHFDEAMLAELTSRGNGIAHVTLHVGAGTFQPVRVDNIAEHRMHSERYNVPESTVYAIEQARKRGGRIIAVGTTALRALESAARGGTLVPGSSETDIFITPGFRFNVVDRLLTNFHLPKSTLLMLVSAFGGMENIQAAYAHAVANRYRFFSYGDAMLIERRRYSAT